MMTDQRGEESKSLIMIKITWIMDNEDDNVHVHDFNCHEIYGRRLEFSRGTFQMMTNLSVEESKSLIMIKIFWTMI